MVLRVYNRCGFRSEICFYYYLQVVCSHKKNITLSKRINYCIHIVFKIIINDLLIIIIIYIYSTINILKFKILIVLYLKLTFNLKFKRFRKI